MKITKIITYHWNNGKGRSPGDISLYSDLEEYGPWEATGMTGANNVQNAYWQVTPNIVLEPGSYSVTDSDPDTWSTNNEADSEGMVTIYGEKQ